MRNPDDFAEFQQLIDGLYEGLPTNDENDPPPLPTVPPEILVDIDMLTDTERMIIASWRMIGDHEDCHSWLAFMHNEWLRIYGTA